MSISSALSNAYSGLSAVSRNAEVISNNVSNALTEGYSRRVIDLSSNVLGGQGGGVKVDGIARQNDPIGLFSRRQSESVLTHSENVSNGIEQLSRLLGEPGNPLALASKFAAFENAILAAISSPDSTALLNSVVSDAKSLVGSFNAISTDIARIRADADTSIDREVAVLNSSLQRIESLNRKILTQSNGGKSVAGFEDQRQSLIDKVNQIIPVRIVQKDSGFVALFTSSGTILLNDTAREVEFSPSPTISPDMTVVSGALSEITINGVILNLSRITKGSLAAHIHIRDGVAPRFQSQIDGLTRDLVDRFQSVGVDPSNSPGNPGLFTDQGVPFAVSNEVGLAGRLEINMLVDPVQAGEIWKIRDGLGVVTQGDVGNISQLLRFQSALTNTRLPNSGMEVLSSMSASGFAEEISGFWALEQAHNEIETAGFQAQYEVFRMSELNSTAVDTDTEMQSLLLVEQAYAANAKMISVIDKLMQTLLEI